MHPDPIRRMNQSDFFCATDTELPQQTYLTAPLADRLQDMLDLGLLRAVSADVGDADVAGDAPECL
jgi:hypothetical protein